MMMPDTTERIMGLADEYHGRDLRGCAEHCAEWRRQLESAVRALAEERDRLRKALEAVIKEHTDPVDEHSMGRLGLALVQAQKALAATEKEPAAPKVLES